MAAKKHRWLSVAPPLPPDVYLRRPRPRLPFPLDEPGHRVYARARHGLYNALAMLDLREGDEALVPAYHHGSEIETLYRAGLRCRFYDCDDRLAPDEEELERLVGPRTRLLHLTHYFGFPQDVMRWKAWCHERRLLLVEDAAQSWLASSGGQPVGSVGDIAIYCLHKSFGVPDGGALIAKRPPSPPRGVRSRGARMLLVRHKEWLAQRSRMFEQLRAADRHGYRDAEIPERAFALGDPDRPASRATAFLLRRIADPGAAARRRTNHARLVERLPPDIVPEAFRKAPAGSAPYVLLVETGTKSALLEQLAAHGVVGGKLWEVPHPSLDVDRFPVASRLRRTLVGLPVHHELRPADVECIAAVAARAHDRVSR